MDFCHVRVRCTLDRRGRGQGRIDHPVLRIPVERHRSVGWTRRSAEGFFHMELLSIFA